MLDNLTASAGFSSKYLHDKRHFRNGPLATQESNEEEKFLSPSVASWHCFPRIFLHEVLEFIPRCTHTPAELQTNDIRLDFTISYIMTTTGKSIA
jgi:hypothetical protein